LRHDHPRCPLRAAASTNSTRERDLPALLGRRLPHTALLEGLVDEQHLGLIRSGGSPPTAPERARVDPRGDLRGRAAAAAGAVSRVISATASSRNS
ncbi:hypothetical protein ABK046_45350, partial [Streptomyces caeruleatus]